MSDYKYYTPIDLVQKILSLLQQKEYDSVIDICCGSWNLLKAAEMELTCNNIIGVDIDNTVKKLKNNRFVFFNMDGREYAIQNQKHRYDLVLSNPPFGKLEKTKQYMKANIDDEKYADILTNRYENEMLLANILLLKKNGVLIVILPSTFIYGKTNLKARKCIAKHFWVKAIIDLPYGTFKNAELQTTAIILINQQEKRNTQYYTAIKKETWEIQLEYEMLYSDILSGVWGKKTMRLNDEEIVVNIFRGKIASNMFTDGGQLIYHCSSNIINGEWFPSIRYCDKNIKNFNCVMDGDILINRIGRCAGYWTIYNGEKALVSDCLLVLKNEKGNLQNIMIRNSTNGRLNIKEKGVATRYITKEDVIKILST